MQEWPALALFWYAPHATGSIANPIFGRPLNFFLFTLPAWQILLGWLLTLAVIACVVAVVLIAIAGGLSLLERRSGSHQDHGPGADSPSPSRSCCWWSR